MNKKNLIITILFLVTAIVNLYSVATVNQGLEFLSKPLICVLLAFIYISATKKPNFWYVSALFFSFWGDVLLLFPEKYFVLGLVSFLLSHILYITIIKKELPKIKIREIVFSALPFMSYFMFIIWLIKENVGELLIPIIIYGLVITAFGTSAVLNYSKNKSRASLSLLIGAILFILSDSIIAINKFYHSALLYQIVIMATYILAQYLILQWVLKKTQK